jgi:hypothetical protein
VCSKVIDRASITVVKWIGTSAIRRTRLYANGCWIEGLKSRLAESKRSMLAECLKEMELQKAEMRAQGRGVE